MNQTKTKRKDKSENEQKKPCASDQSILIYRVISRIWATGICHDYQDVLEFGLIGTLSRYGLHNAVDGIDTEHKKSLFKELLHMGAIVQTREICRQVDKEQDPLLTGVCEVEFSLRDEKLFRKVYLASLEIGRA